MISTVTVILSMCLLVNSIMQSIVFIILLSCIHITIQQQQCPIGQLSFDGKKCINEQNPSSIAKSYFDAESDCKEKAESIGISHDRTFLVSISNSAQNKYVIGR